jgi:hypothetical protein
MWRICWAPNNVSKWQTGFNSAFKGLRTERVMIKKNAYWSSCEVPVILLAFQWNFSVFNGFFKKHSKTKFHENPSSGSRVFYSMRTDGQTRRCWWSFFFLAILQTRLKINCKTIFTENYTTQKFHEKPFWHGNSYFNMRFPKMWTSLRTPVCHVVPCTCDLVHCVWNVMAHGDAREGKWSDTREWSG